jgi:hypothetical protein
MYVRFLCLSATHGISICTTKYMHVTQWNVSTLLGENAGFRATEIRVRDVPYLQCQFRSHWDDWNVWLLLFVSCLFNVFPLLVV